jgi:hypothetical protein
MPSLPRYPPILILAGGLASIFYGEAGIYVFLWVLALPRPIATSAEPNCHTLRDHTIKIPLDERRYISLSSVQSLYECRAEVIRYVRA